MYDTAERPAVQSEALSPPAPASAPIAQLAVEGLGLPSIAEAPVRPLPPPTPATGPHSLSA